MMLTVDDNSLAMLAAGPLGFGLAGIEHRPGSIGDQRRVDDLIDESLEARHECSAIVDRARVNGHVELTNTSPLVAPTRARVSMLGTNPIAVAAPAGKYEMLVLDMATSTIPRGRIEVAARRGERLPVGWAIAPDGSPATTPEQALAGSLQPLGGEESTAGYKGYGLALIVELLTGVLGGAAFGPNIIGLFSTAGKSDLGQFYMAIDPGAIDDRAAFVARL